MKGVAISLYDKFDDLAILVDTIRYNWESDVFISVCSNHPQAESNIQAANIDIDQFQKGAQIRYDNELSKSRGNNNLYLRIYDSIRTSCRPIIENTNVDYFTHLHADAWQLTDSGFDTIINEMKNKGADVSFPSETKTFHKDYPPGFIDDQYIVFDNTAARDVDLFERKPLEIPPMSIHLLLGMVLISKYGWDRLHQYTNGIERVHWDGLSSQNNPRPMFHNPDYDQLHVATEDFGETLGKELQAYYLSKYEVTEGENISRFLEEYKRPKGGLFRDLEAYFNSLSNQLPVGVSAKTFGRDVRPIRDYIEADSAASRLKILTKQYHQNAFYPVVKGVYDTIQRLIKFSRYGDQDYQHPDQAINKIFREDLKKDDFPADMKKTYQKGFNDD
ncbi:hypothetical protein NDI54_06270 [Haloarcula sp. S1AR25-5A]|uniref:Uncharacterized protein n=1 Tax=Haloarcula terrestris TaxID=2950533 RepID=A0AAE4EVK4_9EURY|nr:hypothetical protein [Haloarcula terrestris]MDS0220950.1 hypothetical protein [Haloarcula terrestris]